MRFPDVIRVGAEHGVVRILAPRQTVHARGETQGGLLRMALPIRSIPHEIYVVRFQNGRIEQPVPFPSLIHHNTGPIRDLPRLARKENGNGKKP